MASATIASMSAGALVATPGALAVKDLKAAGARVSVAAPRRSVCVRAEGAESSRRDVVKMAGAAVLGLALFGGAGNAKAGLVDELLAKSTANKALNDKKRLATSYANFFRAYTVQTGQCSFPNNFTGCEDLAKKKQVQFLTEDYKIECEGKDPYKCAEDSHWKGK